MERHPINPSQWSQNLGFHLGELVCGETRRLICAGQTSVDHEGRPQHAEDMRSQIALSLENLHAVLDAAEMSFADVVRVRIYATDVAEALKNFDLLGARFGGAGVKPPMTLVGVTQLALPELMFEIEAEAAV